MPNIMKRPRVRVTVDADAYDDLYDEYSLVIQENDALAKRVEEREKAEEFSQQIEQALDEYVDITNYLLDFLLEKTMYSEYSMTQDAKSRILIAEEDVKPEKLSDWFYYNSDYTTKAEISAKKEKAEERLGSSFSVFEAIAEKKLEEKRREIFEKARKELEDEREAEECSQPAE